MTTDTVELLQGINIAILDGNELMARLIGVTIFTLFIIVGIATWPARGRL